MKTRIFFLMIFIIITFSLSGQQDNKWAISGNVGFGMDEQSRSYIATSIGLEHFLSKRFSLGLGFNHASSYKIEDKNYSLYFEGKGFVIDEYYSDYLASFLNAALLIRYYPIKMNKFWMAINVGPTIQMNRYKYIQYVDNGVNSHISVHSFEEIDAFFMYGMNLTYFINKKIGLNINLYEIYPFRELDSITIGAKVLF